jgi:tol-pal system-associated acyl-CoA thioesterase
VSSAEFSFKLRVYIEDTDAGGIVYYVNYLKFMERARTEFMRSLGFDREFIFSHELMFVVRDAAIQYLAPAQLDDELLATARVTELRGASMRLEQSVRRGGETLARADISVACVDRKGVKPRRLPSPVRDALRAVLRATNDNEGE